MNHSSTRIEKSSFSHYSQLKECFFSLLVFLFLPGYPTFPNPFLCGLPTFTSQLCLSFIISISSTELRELSGLREAMHLKHLKECLAYYWYIENVTISIMPFPWMEIIPIWKIDFRLCRWTCSKIWTLSWYCPGDFASLHCICKNALTWLAYWLPRKGSFCLQLPVTPWHPMRRVGCVLYIHLLPHWDGGRCFKAAGNKNHFLFVVKAENWCFSFSFFLQLWTWGLLMCKIPWHVAIRECFGLMLSLNKRWKHI